MQKKCYKLMWTSCVIDVCKIIAAAGLWHLCEKYLIQRLVILLTVCQSIAVSRCSALTYLDILFDQTLSFNDHVKRLLNNNC